MFKGTIWVDIYHTLVVVILHGKRVASYLLGDNVTSNNSRPDNDSIYTVLFDLTPIMFVSASQQAINEN